MNIKPVDDLNNLFAVKDVLPEELLDELATIEDFMELQFTKMAGQEYWNRRTITVEPDSVFSKINQFINSQRELISASIGENIVMACPNYWMDLEEFTVGVHVDNPNVNIVMQLYLSDCDNAGTIFYNIEEDEIEVRDDAQKWWYNSPTDTSVSIRHSFDCVKNTGYIMINNKTQLHGNPEMLLSKDDVRLSAYCHLYTEQEYNKPKRN